MIDRYRVSAEVILDDLGNVIFSPASAAGRLPSSSPDGPMIETCGPEAVPASRSAPPASAVEPPTSATCGPTSQGSSGSAALQQCLASRLRQGMDVDGSPEYSLTWKAWAMPSREPICALRASGRRISVSGFTGWPTPTIDAKDWSAEAAAKWVNGCRTTHHLDLGDGSKAMVSLNQVATLCGWATPTTRDHKDGAAEGTAPINGLLGRQAWLSRAPTGSKGALNPLFSLWLMLGSGALARAWASCAGPAMRSSRRSPRNSSPP